MADSKDKWPEGLRNDVLRLYCTEALGASSIAVRLSTQYPRITRAQVVAILANKRDFTGGIIGSSNDELGSTPGWDKEAGRKK